MGPSGSGKTTLLNSLANHVPAKSGMKLTGGLLGCLVPQGVLPGVCMCAAGPLALFQTWCLQLVLVQHMGHCGRVGDVHWSCRAWLRESGTVAAGASR